ncbi:hypothetical protein J6590_096348, partial [Homalodisca vitripennis]
MDNKSIHSSAIAKEVQTRDNGEPAQNNVIQYKTLHPVKRALESIFQTLAPDNMSRHAPAARREECCI